MLAGLLKGPSYFNPDRHPDRAKERLAYVLGRMQEDGVISAEQKDQALARRPKLVAFERPHRDSGFHFVDFLGREAKTDGVNSLTAQSYTVHSTINAQLAARHRSGAAGGLGAIRAFGRPHAVPRPRSEHRRRRPRSSRADKPARPRRRGSRRCKRCTCRSTTCIGRRRWWCKRATARRATTPSASALPTAASCR